MAKDYLTPLLDRISRPDPQVQARKTRTIDYFKLLQAHERAREQARQFGLSHGLDEEKFRYQSGPDHDLRSRSEKRMQGKLDLERALVNPESPEYRGSVKLHGDQAFARYYRGAHGGQVAKEQYGQYTNQPKPYKQVPLDAKSAMAALVGEYGDVIDPDTYFDDGIVKIREGVSVDPQVLEKIRSDLAYMRSSGLPQGYAGRSDIERMNQRMFGGRQKGGRGYLASQGFPMPPVFGDYGEEDLDDEGEWVGDRGLAPTKPNKFATTEKSPGLADLLDQASNFIGEKVTGFGQPALEKHPMISLQDNLNKIADATGWDSFRTDMVPKENFELYNQPGVGSQAAGIGVGAGSLALRMLGGLISTGLHAGAQGIRGYQKGGVGTGLYEAGAPVAKMAARLGYEAGPGALDVLGRLGSSIAAAMAGDDPQGRLHGLAAELSQMTGQGDPNVQALVDQIKNNPQGVVDHISSLGMHVRDWVSGVSGDIIPDTAERLSEADVAFPGDIAQGRRLAEGMLHRDPSAMARSLAPPVPTMEGWRPGFRDIGPSAGEASRAADSAMQRFEPAPEMVQPTARGLENQGVIRNLIDRGREARLNEEASPGPMDPRMSQPDGWEPGVADPTASWAQRYGPRMPDQTPRRQYDDMTVDELAAATGQTRAPQDPTRFSPVPGDLREVGQRELRDGMYFEDPIQSRPTDPGAAPGSGRSDYAQPQKEFRPGDAPDGMRGIADAARVASEIADTKIEPPDVENFFRMRENQGKPVTPVSEYPRVISEARDEFLHYLFNEDLQKTGAYGEMRPAGEGPPAPRNERLTDYEPPKEFEVKRSPTGPEPLLPRIEAETLRAVEEYSGKRRGKLAPRDLRKYETLDEQIEGPDRPNQNAAYGRILQPERIDRPSPKAAEVSGRDADKAEAKEASGRNATKLAEAEIKRTPIKRLPERIQRLDDAVVEEMARLDPRKGAKKVYEKYADEFESREGAPPPRASEAKKSSRPLAPSKRKGYRRQVR